jgi:protein SCO1
MTRTIRAMSPQLVLAACIAACASTLWIDVRHARPDIERWLAERDSSPTQLRVEPRTSLDALNIALETSSGERLSLAATGGRVRIATMFYAHCPTMCPMTLDTLKRLDAALSETEREKLGVLLLSLDPARDSPAVLQQFQADHVLAANRYLLARTSKYEVSRLADALRISPGSEAGGMVDHSAALVLFDANGRELARTEHVGQLDASFLTAVRQALAAGTHS